MKKIVSILLLASTTVTLSAQTGHVMQGVGAHNMSMGGASTGQVLDINGALQWNPAGITAFSGRTISINVGLFGSSPQVSSTMPTPGGNISGTTKDERGMSVMPNLAMVWSKKNSKSHFGVSAYGISGFGVTFPESATNPVTMPQQSGGFGQVKSDYQLLQVGLTWAYQLNDKVSVGVAPTFNYSALELLPNPLSSPSPTKGYPGADKATALGIGGQAGIYFNSGTGFKMGASYKSQQYFQDFNFKNYYADGSQAPNVDFKMNYPAIASAGLGYTNKLFDFALDYRFIDYKNTKGFDTKGWTPTASVAGFGWENISVVSAGVQYKALKAMPFRIGYTYSSNPITSELAMFSLPATAIIKHAFQFGFGFEAGKKLTLNGVFHHGSSGGSLDGALLHPGWITNTNPYGAVPGSKISYKMTTNMLMFGVNYKL
ncbi:MAG TPA: outer membrane protein transport protein [Chitinophagaceae bacterium]|nr:outer membrane protein transport protein [Chitinophagaceae bacterium]